MILFILLVLSSILAIVAWLRWLWSRRELYVLSWQMPGPSGFPLLGSALPLIWMEKLDFIAQKSKEYDHLDSPFKVWLGPRMFVYVDNLKGVETVVTSNDCLDRQESYQYIQEALGVNGIFTLDGPMWKHHRRLVSPSFNYNIVVGYLPIINSNCKILIDGLQEKVGKGTFNVRDVIVRTMLNLFLEATFGTNMTLEDKERFKRYISSGQQIVSKRMFLPWFQIDAVWRLTKYSKLLKKYRVFAKRLVTGLITETLKNGSDNITFLERLLRVSDENESFTHEDVRAEATNTLTAAADTSGWSVAFTLLMLAMNQDLQDQVVDELRSVLPDKNSPAGRADLDKLELLDRCMNESLRLFPVVTIMARRCSTPFKIQDYEIKPGMSIAIGIRQIHRNPKYWGPNADNFDPDNFLPERVKARSPYCFIPFSAGPRNCIGQKYAMAVMKVMLAHILRNFRITTDLKMDELRVRMDINIFLIGGHQVQVHPRDY